MPTQPPHLVTRALLSAISLYRNTLSCMMLPSCRFWPSCSVYAEQALQSHGTLRGTALAIQRILRCHPFCAGGWDPVA